MSTRPPAATGQLDLFELFELAADDRIGATEVTSLYASSTRGLAARTAELDRWIATHRGCRPARSSHAWRVGLCEPDTITAQCQPTVLTCDLRCDCHDPECSCVGDLLYRGACRCCDWEGEPTDDQVVAVGEGLDHAHPGWRTAPAVDALPHSATRKQAATWRAAVDAAYGPRPTGFPIITRRPPRHGRAMADRSPWAGYDVAAAATTDTPMVAHTINA